MGIVKEVPEELQLLGAMGIVREELQLLGAMGIVREAFNILLRSSRRRLLWVLALTLLLRFCFASLGHRFFSAHHFPKIAHKQIQETIVRGDTIWCVWREFLVGVAAYKTSIAPYEVFGLALSVLSTVAVVYTVASIYTANTKNLKVSYATGLRADVPMVWKSLTLTILWFSIISFGFMMVYMLVNGLLFTVFVPTNLFPAVGEEADHKSHLGTSLVLALAFPLGVILVNVYVRTVCYLASVVSVLEDKYYGLAAVKKNIQLIKGKQTTALALIILHDIFAAAIGELFVYSVVDGRSHGVGITVRALNGLLLFGLLCFVNLMVMLTECLLYFVCKSYHHESIDNNSLFKVYKSGTMSL